ncbi:hypothetical protein GOODEAATRI_015426 [Goodea atripinnis]|uniref:Uncharacterized protein n=1 Tax=Goodea atripinnis TaxID=208336 RepID=A0ABV0NUS6_9TELE
MFQSINSKLFFCSHQNMKLVQEEEEDGFGNDANKKKKETWADPMNNDAYPDYGDDYDDYVQNHRRKLFSFVAPDANNTLDKPPNKRQHIKNFQNGKEKDGIPQPLKEPGKEAKEVLKQDSHQNRTGVKQDGSIEKVEPKIRPANEVIATVKPKHTNSSMLVGEGEIIAKPQPAVLPQKHTSKQHPILRSQKTNHTLVQTLKGTLFQNQDRHAAVPRKNTVANKRKLPERKKVLNPGVNSHFTTPSRGGSRFIVKSNEVETDPRKALREKEIGLNKPLQQDLDNHINRDKMNAQGKKEKSYLREKGGHAREEDSGQNRTESRTNAKPRDSDSMWGQQRDLPINPEEENITSAPVFDTQVNWNQTFQVNELDLQSQRSDWIDLQCNVSGNMLLNPSDALNVVYAFMDHLNEKHNR